MRSRPAEASRRPSGLKARARISLAWGGVITYANQEKTRLLGVSAEMLREQGAVSEPVAREMAIAVRQRATQFAILRTLGASPRSIMSIFVVQGAAAGVIGTLAGTLLGLVVAFNIDVIVPFIERMLNTTFLPSSVYLISRMPSDPQRGDIVPIVVISLLLAFVATLYPSWRASRVNPAEALRYE